MTAPPFHVSCRTITAPWFADEFDTVIGVETSTGVIISSVSKHAVERAVERGIIPQEVIDALQNPLKVGKIKLKLNGFSQEFVGKNARVHINPNSGNIITMWKTGSKYLKKL